MSRTLSSEKLLHQDLFHIDGALVENYNRALEKIVGLQTKQESFHVDMRGESPELEEELGKNYLQIGSSNRYAIVVSPNQKDAGLLHEEFSYDNSIFNKLYENNTGSISVVTRVDSLFGELKNGVDVFTSPRDLLLLKSVNLHLGTPSNFIDMAREQQQAIKQLRENPNLLTKNNSEHVHYLISLVEQVGDVRNYSLASIIASHDIENFSTRLFDGVYVFREDTLNVPVEVRRPSNHDQMQRLKEQIYGSGKRKKSLRKVLKKLEEISGVKPSVRPHTTIYCDAGHDFDSAEHINVLTNKDEAVDFLLRSKFAKLDKDRIESSKNQIEDLTLLERGYDLAQMSPHERSRAISKEYKEFPRAWKYLHDTLSNEAAGYAIEGLLQDADAHVQSLLLKATPGPQEPVVNRLIARLNQVDFHHQLHYAPRDLEHRFESASKEFQNYIIKLLR